MDVKVKIQVREMRTQKGLTIMQLSQRSGVSKTHISAIETGLRMPSVYVICRLAAAMDVRPEELYFYEIKK